MKKVRYNKAEGRPNVATNEMEALGRFERLEERILRLLDVNAGMAAENEAMRVALADKAREIEELKERIERLDREKGAVKEKVDTLLARLDSLV